MVWMFTWHVSNFSCCSHEITYKSNIMNEAFVPAQGLRGHSPLSQKRHGGRNVRGLVTLCLSHEQRETDMGPQLIFSFTPFLFSVEAHVRGWCFSHSGSVFPPHSNLSRNLPTNMPEMHFMVGDSVKLTVRITHHTQQEWLARCQLVELDLINNRKNPN